jgi:hypothetical protein
MLFCHTHAGIVLRCFHKRISQDSHRQQHLLYPCKCEADKQITDILDYWYTFKEYKEKIEMGGTVTLSFPLCTCTSGDIGRRFEELKWQNDIKTLYIPIEGKVLERHIHFQAKRSESYLVIRRQVLCFGPTALIQTISIICTCYYV